MSLLAGQGSYWTLPVDIATLRERVSKLADQPKFQSLLMSFFASTDLALALIGLYGVIAFLVAQRTHEIGVRLALGADRSDILRLVMGRSLRLIIAGIVLGLMLALVATRCSQIFCSASVLTIQPRLALPRRYWYWLL
jgi:putative ABC transport system permease protein